MQKERMTNGSLYVMVYIPTIVLRTVCGRSFAGGLLLRQRSTKLSTRCARLRQSSTSSTLQIASIHASAKVSRRRMLPVQEAERLPRICGNDVVRGSRTSGSRSCLEGLEKTDMAIETEGERPLNQHTLILASFTSTGWRSQY